MLDYIVNVPSLIYLKAPVGTLNELYTRYPDGGEYGWFAFVFEKKTFYFWNVDTRNWELMQNGQEMHIHYHNGCERTVKLQKKEDLVKASTWTVDGAIQIPYGIPITVYNDTDDNNGIYLLPLSKDYTVITNWINSNNANFAANLDTKAPKANPEFTGHITLNGELFNSDTYKSNITIIDTGDFIPVNSQLSGSGYEYQITPGSYGVEFTDAPISWLSDRSFNLKVEYLSHDGYGGDGDQDFIHTLTAGDGRSFTRRVYKENQQLGYTSTPFTTALGLSATQPETTAEGQEWLSTSTITKYTKLGNTFIEL